MNGSAPKTYRFGQVAAAAGVSDSTLRNWLFRAETRGKKLDLFTDRPAAGGWRSFDERDVWVFALAAEFMRHGAVIEEAVDAARQGMGLYSPDDLSNVPSYLYAAPDSLGWVILEDEGMVRDISGHLTVLKIAFREVLATASSRLRASQ